MKYIKMLSLAAVAAAALMAFAGSASATELYSGATTLGSGTKIESTGTSAVLKAGFSTITCNHSEVDGKTSNTGGAGVSVEGSITTLAFSECDAVVKVLKPGKLTVHHIAGTDDGTVTSQGAEVTVEKSGIHCIYGTPTATDIGKLDGKTGAKEDAVLSATASLQRVSGSFLCANPATWTATYTVTTPTPLHVTAS